MLANNVRARVFANEDEDIDKVTAKFRNLFPFDLDKGKIPVSVSHAAGFNEKKIAIIETQLTKPRHVESFLAALEAKLDAADKDTILRQLDSRLGEELNLFVRLAKETWIRENRAVVTDSGNCIHIRISLATFPKNREAALRIAKSFLKGEKRI